MNFKALHNADQPLLLCNVWDVASARVAEKLGFQAIGTSSAAIATILGYEDGENMSFSELYDVVNKIKKHTHIPLTVDIESGYNRDPIEVVNHIKKLSNLGVVGINIEDSVVTEERTLLDASSFAKSLSKIIQQLKKDDFEMFVNVRTDVFLLGCADPVSSAKERIRLFEKTGADGIFIPCIEESKDIQFLTEYCSLPINVMCMPNLPDFSTLKALGVKRISMGNFLFNNMYKQLESTLASVLNTQSFKEIF